MLPCDRRSQRAPSARSAETHPTDARKAGNVSWTTAAILILAVILGAASAALVFHDRLPVVARDVGAQSIP